MSMTAKEANALRWYLTHQNNGRGRIVGESARFLKLGYLALKWTGPKSWVLSITHNGRQALMTLECPCPECKLQAREQ